MTSSMDATCHLARTKQITFSDFYARTKLEWRRISRSILRRWDVPTWFGEQDVEQELILAAWRATHTWRDGRGVAIGRFVVWNAYTMGKRAVHRARLGKRAHRNEAITKSRYEVFANDLVARPGEPTEVDGASVLAIEQPTQEVEAVRASVIRLAIPKARHTADALALRALAAVGGRSIDDAATLLYDHPGARLACRLLSEEHAGQVVAGAVAHMARCNMAAGA